MTEAESEAMSFEVAKCYKPRNIGGHGKLRKARKQILSSEAPEQINPASSITLAQ